MSALLVAAVAAHLVSLPSPLTPLSSSPPVGGGARTAGEGTPHRVQATTRVTVSIGPSGAPTALRAVQRLDVLRVGDYTFTVGAPVTRVEAAPGSQSTPGRRTGAILWAGFDPGKRTLAAAAELELTAAGSLPLRIEIKGGRLTLHNATAVTATTFAADAERAELLARLASFRKAASSGTPAIGGAAMLRSPVTSVQARISAPLEVTGTIGNRTIDLTLGGATHPPTVTLPAGRVQLAVRPLPAPELLRPPAGESGRALLARTIRASLELARVRQYNTFLGNPDPGGTSRTTYVYVTADRAARPPAAAVPTHGGGQRLRTFLWALGALVAFAVGALVWARS